MIAFVFPGQGAQTVGMGVACAEASAAARAAFATASRASGLDLLALCREGPAERLAETEITQPAILAASAAVLAMLQDAGLRPDAVAGLSLGEYTALVAAGALDLETAAALVRRRGRYMQEAVPLGAGAMAAILGLDRERVEQVCRDTPGVVTPSNYNCPGQTVISGEASAVAAAAAACRAAGARKATVLPVSAPFHCPLMAPAAERLRPDLESARIAPARIPVVCNVDAAPVREPEAIRRALLLQVDHPVRWEECVRTLWGLGCDTFVEVGPGGALTAFLKRIEPRARGVACATPQDVTALAVAS
jgi:[acyl-carrier-protein] S-malonyltransferase